MREAHADEVSFTRGGNFDSEAGPENSNQHKNENQDSEGTEQKDKRSNNECRDPRPGPRPENPYTDKYSKQSAYRKNTSNRKQKICGVSYGRCGMRCDGQDCPKENMQDAEKENRTGRDPHRDTQIGH